MLRCVEVNSVLAAATDGRNVDGCGVEVAPAGSWNVGDERHVPLTSVETLRILHDTREAPLVVGIDGQEDSRVLVSLSDEENVNVCAWLRLTSHSPLVGLGIDLANPADFDGKRGKRFNHLIFTQAEQALVEQTYPHNLPLGYAFAFSAKEAAFKACAAPLRAWYRSHEEKLLFDLRSFELDGWEYEAGTARHAHAQQAMAALGISRLELHRTAFEGLAVTLALALSD